MAKIIYTHTDEAPLLATYSFLPIIAAYAAKAGVEVETRDISLSGRILAQFGLADDALAELGELAKQPEANIIKLPNVSASIPQLKTAIKELQSQGFDLPDYPENAQSEDEKATVAKYDKVKGSAVNPVLREGNSDRRAPLSVKNYAKTHPHRMGKWTADSKTNVATMGHDDFFSNELSVVMRADDTLTIKHVGGRRHRDRAQGRPQGPGRRGRGRHLHGRRSAAPLPHRADRARQGRGRAVLGPPQGHDDEGLRPDHLRPRRPGLLPHALRAVRRAARRRRHLPQRRPRRPAQRGRLPCPRARRSRLRSTPGSPTARPIAMVDSDKGITNLHVPSDVIIDASMPAMIRTSGHMWGPDGDEADTLAVIPDSCYAGVYQTVIDDCRAHGAFDPATMGSVPNVGLMAQAAEEYGSHDKTFEVPAAGTVQVVNAAGEVLIEHDVEPGDIWRACQTKDAPIRDWVKLAVTRARASGSPAIFWLDENRAHDANLIAKVEDYLPEHDTDGLDIEIMAPAAATAYSLERIRKGEDTISVTGNVLRDYNTDLFPILELGTSAKMLSVVPLMNGGGLFETGAGGSAPKHVQQLVKENYLRWDSLGEFFALAACFEHLAPTPATPGARCWPTPSTEPPARSSTRTSPRPVKRRRHRQPRHALLPGALLGPGDRRADRGRRAGRGLQAVAETLAANEEKIVAELNAVQGSPADIGGYYRPDDAKAEAVMRPSETLNEALASLG